MFIPTFSNSTGENQKSQSRNFPDVSFVDIDTERLVNGLIRAWETINERVLFPSDPTRLFILWIADIIVQERVIIDNSAKQNVPRFAENQYLDSLAEIFRDTQRLQAVPARTTLQFSISAPQSTAVTIPQGTRVTIDGEITFATVSAAVIPSGEQNIDVPAVCITTKIDPDTEEEVTIGVSGNGFFPGQINQIVDLFPFFESVKNTTTSEGGADKETDSDFYERLRQSMSTFSTAGPLGAYIYWAMTASASIADVKPTSPAPGVVDIRILLENGVMPDSEIKQLVLDTVSADNVRPFTDYVTVSAPDPKPFSVDLTYFIYRNSENSAAVIRAQVDTAVREYIRWQTERMGRDINPDVLITLIRNAGAKRAEIRSPVFTVVEEIEVAVVSGEATVIYGGLESG